MRLFAALPLAPAVVEHFNRLYLRLSKPDDGLRWSSPEQWHITLQFYGELDDAQARCLASAFEGLQSCAPELMLTGLEQFSAKGILYAAFALTPSLVQLQQASVVTGNHCGAFPETRPFRPHVTLARSRGRAGFTTLRQFSSFATLAHGTNIRWFAPEAHLLSSTLRLNGAQYEVVARVPLAKSPPLGDAE